MTEPTAEVRSDSEPRDRHACTCTPAVPPPEYFCSRCKGIFPWTDNQHIINGLIHIVRILEVMLKNQQQGIEHIHREMRDMESGEEWKQEDGEE